MAEKWYQELIADMAGFVPDQTWPQILEQFIKAMMACDGKFTSAGLGRLVEVAAAIKRQSDGTKGCWETCKVL